jgi:NitT/TauT family transport system ATP-binding protein
MLHQPLSRLEAVPFETRESIAHLPRLEPLPSSKISIDELTLAYGSSVILEGVSLEIEDRELVCLIGSSGCGKTTLLHAVAGLLAPTQGMIAVDGVPVEKPGPDRVMVFQDDAVFPWMTVGKNVEYGLRIQSLPRSSRQAKVERALELVGLEGKEKLYPRQLSGGMRKRVDLARALAVEPAILLMDEPYAALDMMTKERLQVEFERIYEESRMTVIFVTHDLEEALFLGDRVVAMGLHPGRIHWVLEVPFSRPRSLDLKRSPEFQALRGELIRQLEAAARPGTRRADD